jgi:glycogen synthase
LRIAFFTYEYPPDIAQGGIATYVKQVARLLAEREHDVEVFCASPYRTVSIREDNVLVHRLQSDGPATFNRILPDFFAGIHSQKAFDIIESPEIHGHAYLIKQQFPSLPLVVKFHMPVFIQMRLINFYTSRIVKLRYFLGALRRGRIRFYGYNDHNNDIDYKVTSVADAYVSPSRSLGAILQKEWKLKPEKLTVLPYPFIPPRPLLDIPITERKTKVVSFVGKLNVHKGIVALVEMIRKVVPEHPDVQFRLIGADSFFPARNMSMKDYISSQLQGLEANYVIKGGLDYEAVLQELAETDICIFPSIWENFPNVCLEAMSAGRAVIGSKNGGMSEMLEDGAGVIIDPLQVHAGAKAISVLLDNPARRVALGIKARLVVLERYNADRIGLLLEKHFSNVITDVC